ncbi:hypothetical protein G6F68_021580 [Rhizopus microsporus]|nr:hypothetical protein G6F68_021580 [Rhizopus microsporus]
MSRREITQSSYASWHEGRICAGWAVGRMSPMACDRYQHLRVLARFRTAHGGPCSSDRPLAGLAPGLNGAGPLRLLLRVG